jgi:hypothetical protein
MYNMTKATKSAPSLAVVDRYSLIDATLTRMSEKNNKASLIARKAQQMDHGNPLVRLGKLFTQMQLERKAMNARIKKSGVNEELPFKPEAIVSFTQRLANQCIWSALALTDKMADADDWDADAGGTGTDCYADACDEYGIDPVAPEHLADIVQSDFNAIEVFYSKLMAKTSYLPSHEDLHMYVDSQPDPEDASAPWITHLVADNFDDAITIARDIITELEAKQDEAEMADWESLDQAA